MTTACLLFLITIGNESENVNEKRFIENGNITRPNQSRLSFCTATLKYPSLQAFVRLYLITF